MPRREPDMWPPGQISQKPQSRANFICYAETGSHGTDGELQDNDADKQKKILTLREFDEFNSLNYIELPIKEQACGLLQVPRRGGRKGVAPLNKGLSP